MECEKYPQKFEQKLLNYVYFQRKDKKMYVLQDN